ncbi:MAG: exosortase/archaeosortase family protein [candidate division KSB1 bacterium]|nr:exosortase/archaeosortase family protein [candidate division KSB1 bacterium]
MRSDLKKYTPLVLLSLLILGIYFHQLVDLVYQWWDDPNYGHGFLIPVVSLYLFWQKRDRLQHIEQRRNFWGLAILISGLALCILGTAAAEFFTVRFSFVLVLLGTIWFFYGTDFIKELWFPILFLIFMIPLPYVIYYALSFPLQLLSTKAAVAILQFTGLPALRQGNIINLPHYSLEVVEACSGLRSLMTLSALGAAMAYLTQKTLASGVLLFLLSLPIAVGANIFRILVTALGAVFISPKFAEGFLHEVSGLVVFVSGFIALGILGLVLNALAQWRWGKAASDLIISKTTSVEK